jgi:ELWxxDGT repeat protein
LADNTHGTELWKFNSAGAALVKDINPSGSSMPSYLTNIGGSLFFSADAGDGHGRQVWITESCEMWWGSVVLQTARSRRSHRPRSV